MRAVIQRVNNASVIINDKEYSSIVNGLCIFLAINKNDNYAKADDLIKKISKLNLFAISQTSKFSQNIFDIKAQILIVSQFTLYANLYKGRSPSFSDSMKPNDAKVIYEYFCNEFIKTGLVIKTGIFGEYMKINIENDGPSTFIIDN
jgi:D-aminoacyl-tRNA deacylase